MPAWLIPVALTIGSAILGHSRQKSASRDQRRMAQYNARMGYKVSMNNIQAEYAIAGFNMAMSKALLGKKTAAIQGVTQFNMSMLRATSEYDQVLYEADIARIWKQNNLDIHQLTQQRDSELGTMRANMAASGVVMDVDSSAVAQQSQMTQAAMDVFIVKEGAADAVGDIQNAQARSLWEGEMAIRKAQYDGEMAAYQVSVDTMAGALGSYATTMISGKAKERSAAYAYEAGMQGADFSKIYNDQIATNNLFTGLISAARTGVQGYRGSLLTT